MFLGVTLEVNNYYYDFTKPIPTTFLLILYVFNSNIYSQFNDMELDSSSEFWDIISLSEFLNDFSPVIFSVVCYCSWVSLN